MESFRERIARLSPQRLTLLAMELQDRVARLEGAAHEPVAVVGMACRFPGEADTAGGFWQNLRQRRDCVAPISEARWRLAGSQPSAVNEPSAKWGALLDSIDLFDPAFFHISPSEAAAMDPQQRVLLEVCWEAMENAGIPADSLAGSATGVFVGMSSNDYAMLANSQPGNAQNKYIVTGAANSIAVGRVSYLLGLEGPNMAVDTSCSSSATAIHLAIQSLRRGECDLALAGGVHLAVLPQTNETLSRFNLLAADGRCKTFSDAADGLGRGEGCGILVLKRLRDAQRDQDNIVGVLRGSACNQDGRTSGLTAPNGQAQERVVRAALKDAGLNAADIDYVETHGTGTPLGDPIEVTALGRVFAAEGRDGRRVEIGSVKSNIGHLEAAAGVAGVIKVLLALEHEEIPASLHCAALNGRVPWGDLPLHVAGEAVASARGSRSRVAGVSSFGYSGTNVHIVVEEAPARADLASAPASLEIVTASAKSPWALKQLCKRYAEYLEKNPDISIASFSQSVNEGRSHFMHRMARIVRSTEEANEVYARFAFGAPHDAGNDWLNSASQVIDSSDGGQRMRALQNVLDQYVAGVGVDWKAIPGWQPRPKLALPNYPFQRERYWLELQKADARGSDSADETEPDKTNAAWLYEIAWEPIEAVDAAAPSASPAARRIEEVDRIMASMAPVLEEAAEKVDCSFLPQFRKDADALSVQFILHALEENRLELRPGKCFAGDVCELLGISKRYERLLERIFGILEEEGVVLKKGSEWVVQRVPERFDTGKEIERMRAAYPLAEAHLNVFERASLLGQVFAGRMTGLEILFPRGSMALAEALYQQTVHARVMNPVIAQLAQSVIGSLPADRRVRILELGAGTGSTTGCVLPLLPNDRVEYFFTDVSKHFLAGAAKKFSRYSFLRYVLHDIESSDVLDREPPVSFDLVIAANVLHATKSLRRTLANVRNLLAPGGFLLLLEASHTERLADITLGTIEGWWRFEDTDLRQRSALISPASWQRLLGEMGFRSALLPAKPELFGVTVDEPAILAQLEAIELEGTQPALLETARLRSREPEAGADDNGRLVLLLSPISDFAATMTAHLRSLGAHVIQAVPGSQYERLSDGVYSVALDDKAQVSRLFEHSLLRQSGVLRVSYLPSPSAREPADAARSIALEAVSLLQEVLSRGASSSSLWFVTSGLQPAPSRDAPLAAAVLPGLVRVVASEYPKWRCRGIDGDVGDLDGSAERIAQIIMADPLDGEPELAVRGNRLLAPRLRACTLPPELPLQSAGKSVSGWLITGGFGVLGLLVARWLAERCNDDLILFGRNAPSEEALVSIAEIRRLGAEVTVLVGDISVETDVLRLFQRIALSEGPLRGIVHTAGVLEDVSALQLSSESLDRVLAPKVTGSWLLHKHSSGMPLEHFVLFSSAASVLGTPGQLNYAMANTFLDGLAHYRQAHGLPGVSIDWGPWSTSGADVKRDFLADWRAHGGDAMTPAQGLEVLDRILRLQSAQVAVLPIDWTLFSAGSSRRAVPAMLKGLIASTAGDLSRPAEQDSSLKKQLERSPVRDRNRVIASYIEMRLVRLLGLEEEASIPLDTPFLNLGLDSLMSLELKNELQSAVQVELSPSLFYDHATLRALNAYFSAIFQTEGLGDRVHMTEDGYELFRL